MEQLDAGEIRMQYRYGFIEDSPVQAGRTDGYEFDCERLKAPGCGELFLELLLAVLQLLMRSRQPPLAPSQRLMRGFNRTISLFRRTVRS